MKKVTRNEVDFSEIFEYAEKKFGIGWNPCNDIFFGNSLDYKSHNEFYIGEVLGCMEEPDASFEDMSDSDKGYFIINQFMIDKKVDSIWVDNN